MSFHQLYLQLIGDRQSQWLNRRASVRYQCAPATVGKVYQDSREDFVRIWVLDLSKGGARILLDRELPAGQQVTVQINCPASNKKLNLPARVAHALEQSDGEWLVGLEFQQPLNDDELDTLLN